MNERDDETGSSTATDAGVPPIIEQLTRLRDLLAGRAAQLAQHLIDMQTQDEQAKALQRMHEDAQRRAAEAIEFAEKNR